MLHKNTPEDEDYPFPMGVVPRPIPAGEPGGRELPKAPHVSSRGMLVGVAGRARAGKDTIAGYLGERYAFHRESFAEPIRTFVRHILGLSKDDLETNKETPIGWLDATPRRLMQTVGTEWGRGIDPELWIKSALRRAEPALFSGRNVVISDVRFDNEAEAIKAAGGLIVRVVRPDGAPVEAHASEAGISESLVDITLLNDSSVSWLTAQVDRYVGPRVFPAA